MRINRSVCVVPIALLITLSSHAILPMHYARNILNFCSAYTYKAIALAKKHPKLCAAIIAGTVSYNAINAIKNRAIIRCALSGRSILYKFWHILGARIYPSTEDARIAFLQNVQTNNIWLIKQMIHDGIDINDNRIASDFSSPLHEATRLGHTAMAKLLIDHGASKIIRNSHNQIPLHIAALYKRTEITHTLLATQENKIQQLQAQDINGQTPLHTAAGSGASGTAEILLDAGAAIEATTKLPVTYAKKEHIEPKGLLRPLHLAAEKGDETTIQLLINRGADRTATDEKNRIALAHLQLVWQKSKPTLCALLTPV